MSDLITDPLFQAVLLAVIAVAAYSGYRGARLWFDVATYRRLGRPPTGEPTDSNDPPTWREARLLALLAKAQASHERLDWALGRIDDLERDLLEVTAERDHLEMLEELWTADRPLPTILDRDGRRILESSPLRSGAPVSGSRDRNV